jgi:hypothetical protein
MKFIAISTAFAFSQVLAAPVLLDNVLPEVSGLTGTVENVVASAEGTVGGLVDPLVGPLVGPLVNPVLGTIAGRDVGSTVAGVGSQVSSTLTVVQTLQGNVETELSTIRMNLLELLEFQLTKTPVSAVQGDSTLNVVPTVVAGLQSISTAFQTAQGAISLTNNVPLVGDDVASLTSTLQILNVLVPNVQSTLSSAVSALPASKYL